MKYNMMLLLLFTSQLYAQDDGIGRVEPPFIPASLEVITKSIGNLQSRCEAVRQLSEKTEMNYRLLGMKMMEAWQANVKKDKGFISKINQSKSIIFTVDKDGNVDITIPKKTVLQKLGEYENSEAVQRYRRSRVGFYPVITVLPEGTNMMASAVISGDRRYVRANIAPIFSSVGRIDTFTFNRW
jgi:hypothetical protein